eukprot:1267128-Rhodomonas_salina.1
MVLDRILLSADAIPRCCPVLTQYMAVPGSTREDSQSTGTVLISPIATYALPMHCPALTTSYAPMRLLRAVRHCEMALDDQLQLLSAYELPMRCPVLV